MFGPFVNCLAREFRILVWVSLLLIASPSDEYPVGVVTLLIMAAGVCATTGLALAAIDYSTDWSTFGATHPPN